jgi:hypothetical protein
MRLVHSLIDQVIKFKAKTVPIFYQPVSQVFYHVGTDIHRIILRRQARTETAK